MIVSHLFNDDVRLVYLIVVFLLRFVTNTEVLFKVDEDKFIQ